MKNLVEHNEFVPWRYILAYWHASSNMHVPYVRYHNPLLNTNRTNTDVILWKILLENKEIDFKNGAINIQAPGYIAACISISLLDCSSTLYQIQCTDWGWSPMLTWEGVWPNSLIWRLPCVHASSVRKEHKQIHFLHLLHKSVSSVWYINPFLSFAI